MTDCGFTTDPLGDRTQHTRSTPSNRLFVAIFDDAVTMLTGNGQRERDAAVRWFYSESRTVITSFPFLHVCDALELDPSYVRRELVASRRLPPPGALVLV